MTPFSSFLLSLSADEFSEVSSTQDSGFQEAHLEDRQAEVDSVNTEDVLAADTDAVKVDADAVKADADTAKTEVEIEVEAPHAGEAVLKPVEENAEEQPQKLEEEAKTEQEITLEASGLLASSDYTVFFISTPFFSAQSGVAYRKTVFEPHVCLDVCLTNRRTFEYEITKK